MKTSIQNLICLSKIFQSISSPGNHERPLEKHNATRGNSSMAFISTPKLSTCNEKFHTQAFCPIIWLNYWCLGNRYGCDGSVIIPEGMIWIFWNVSKLLKFSVLKLVFVNLFCRLKSLYIFAFFEKPVYLLPTHP